MNQHDQMREALRRIVEARNAAQHKPMASPEITRLWMRINEAEQFLAHVNETPKNEHDSDDVLNKSGKVDMMREALSQNVRAFRNKNDGEVKYILHSGNNESDWEDVMIIPNLPNEAIDQALAAEPAPLVRLTDDEIECARLEWCKTGWEVTEFSHAIMDAMIAKNGG